VSETAVRQAFAEQAEVCAKLGSAFTGLLCGVLGRALDRSTAVGRRVLDWPGPPDALHDNVPLRLTGGFHALVRSGKARSLAALYPPAPLPDESTLATAVSQTLSNAEAALLPWLQRWHGPPGVVDKAHRTVDAQHMIDRVMDIGRSHRAILRRFEATYKGKQLP